MRKLKLMLLPLLGAFAAAGAAQQQSMLPYLPADTIMAMSMPDLDASMQEMMSMPIAKMWAEQEVQNFVKDARELVDAQVKKALEQAREMHKQGAMPVDPDAAMALRVKGAGVALTRLGLKSGDFGPEPTVGLMLHLEFGDSAQQWFALMNMGMDMLGKSGEMEASEAAVGDIKIHTFKPTNAPASNTMGLNVAMLKSGVLIGTLIDDVRSTVENMVANKPALGANERYKTSTKTLTTEGSEVEMFLRVDPVVDFVMSALEIGAEMNPAMAEIDLEGVRRGMDALGMGSLKSYAMSSSYKDGKSITTGYMHAPAPDRKGFMPTGNKTVDMGFLKWVPKDAVSFWAFTMEPMGWYDAMTGAIRAYDPKVAEEMMAQLAAMEKEMGFSLRDDLFGALGENVITWSKPIADIASTPEMAILVKVNDEQKLLKAIKAMAAASDGDFTLEEAEKRGIKSYQISFSEDAIAVSGMENPLAQFNPTFSFHKGYMVAAFSANDIRRAIQRMDRTEDDPKTDIRGNREFAAYAESLPQGVIDVSFTDWKVTFESYYAVISGVVTILPQNEDIPFDWAMLPDSSALTKHLYGSMSYTTADAEGMTSKSTSPWGPETWMTLVMLGIAAGVGASMMPNLIR